MGRKKDPQGAFDWREHGGKRKGAGRKPKGKQAGVSHKTRHEVDARHPVMVTMTLCDRLPDLRSQAEAEVVLQCLAEGAERDGFRLVHFAVLGNHLHLLIEAEGIGAQSSSLGGLKIRLAKRLSKLWGRKGSIWSDRYHSRALVNPTQVRYAMLYVFRNARKHGIVRGEEVDGLNTGTWFLVEQGTWQREGLCSRWAALVERAMRAPLSWFLRVGWRKAGPITPSDFLSDPSPA